MKHDLLPPHVLVLSTADWDRPIWTNKQHLTVQFAQRWPVIYLESLGLRRPTVSSQDFKRVVRRFAKVAGARPPKSLRQSRFRPANIDVVTPLILPFHRAVTPVWQINAALLRRRIRTWLGTPKDRRVLWTFSPVTYGLEKYAAGTVYHCVDLLGNFPGVDPVAVAQGEKRLAEAGVVALASSTQVLQHLFKSGFPEAQLWQNVADTELIAPIAQAQSKNANHVVFLGNLTASKVDVGLLEAVALLRGVVLHIAGPIAEGGGDADRFGALLRSSNVVYHGVLDPAAAAALMGRCTVGLVPYRYNEYTRGVFPMKVYEYLAAGLAAVCSGVPSVKADEDILLHDGESFVGSVRLAAAGVPAGETVARRVRKASANSWSQRGEDAAALAQKIVRN